MLLLFSGNKVSISTESDSLGPIKAPDGPCGDLSSLTEVYNFMERNEAPFDLLALAHRVATTSPIFGSYLRYYVWGRTESIMRIATAPEGTLVYTELNLHGEHIVYQWSTYGPPPAFGEFGELISTVGNTYTEDCKYHGRLREIKNYLGWPPLT